MKGPGRYDKHCTQLLTDLDADAVMVIVLGGDIGNGFSLSSRESARVLVRALVPQLLREVANEVAGDLEPPASELQ